MYRSGGSRVGVQVDCSGKTPSASLPSHRPSITKQPNPPSPSPHTRDTLPEHASTHGPSPGSTTLCLHGLVLPCRLTSTRAPTVHCHAGCCTRQTAACDITFTALHPSPLVLYLCLCLHLHPRPRPPTTQPPSSRQGAAMGLRGCRTARARHFDDGSLAHY